MNTLEEFTTLEKENPLDISIVLKSGAVLAFKGRARWGIGEKGNVVRFKFFRHSSSPMNLDYVDVNEIAGIQTNNK